MSDKKREIYEDDLKHFLVIVFKHCKIDLSMESAFELSDLIHKCFDDNMMFDSWFCGLDVMN